MIIIFKPYSSDDVELDDSENERATALDDGFDVVENEELLAEKLLIGNMKKSGSSPCTRSKSKGKGKAPLVEPEKKRNLSQGKGKAPMVEPEKKRNLSQGKGKAPMVEPEKKKNLSKGKGKAAMVEPVEEYFNEELDSSDSDESDHEGGPRYENFRREQLNKNFEFRLSMKFNSSREFKDAIIEWNVLNGYEISFEKNESYRVRTVCKEDALKKGEKREEWEKKRKCGYLCLCSKVGHMHTYQIKSYVKDHTCRRVTKNRSAKSKWVANFVVVNKLQTTEKVTIKDIINDMRKNHSIDITKGRAWKAKQIAQKIVDGDADRQYSMVWRYVAELTRVCPDNSAKVNVERLGPTLQPRFGSFLLFL